MKQYKIYIIYIKIFLLKLVIKDYKILILGTYARLIKVDGGSNTYKTLVWLVIWFLTLLFFRFVLAKEDAMIIETKNMVHEPLINKNYLRDYVWTSNLNASQVRPSKNPEWFKQRHCDKTMKSFWADYFTCIWALHSFLFGNNSKK